MIRPRALIAGLAIAGGYVAVALGTLPPGSPARPLFDGFHGPGPAYRYACPPTEDPAALPPAPAEATIEVDERKEDGKTFRVVPGGVVTTGDGQASLNVSSVAIEPPGRRDTKTHFSITPTCAETIGSPPDGTEYDGNALEVTGTYQPSGKPVRFAEQDCALGGCVTLVATFPHAGNQIWRRYGDGWVQVDGVEVFASNTIAAPVMELGTFVVTRPPGTGPGATEGPNVSLIAALAAGGIAVVASVAIQWRRARRRAQTPPKRSSAAKGAARNRATTKSKNRATRGRPRR